jgi:general stress protein CsbA
MVTYPTTVTTADVVINRVAAEVGLVPVVDPLGSSDASFVQLVHLLNTAGDELAVLYNWEAMRREHTITTAAIDTGNYALPTDFDRIVDNSAWDRTSDLPMYGPLSAQDWQALLGRAVTNLINLGWRITEGEFQVYPTPVGVVADIYFEYQSNNWIVATDGTTYKNSVTVNSDVILFNRVLISRYLKLKFLMAKGLDATAAQDDFNQMFDMLTGQDKGAGTLSAGADNGSYPFINAYRNIGNSNFGS